MVLNYLRSRISRGFSLISLGPNEARVLFDLIAAHGALAGALLFDCIFLGSSMTQGRVVAAWLLPLGFILGNAAFGLYSTLKTARTRIKCAVLLLSVGCACVPGAFASAGLAVIVLWVMLVSAPVVLARFFLGLPYSRHRNLMSIAVNRRGPVLLIGGAGYIGTHTVALLLENGFKVRVLDRLMYGRDSLVEFLGNGNFELIEGDVTDITKLALASRNASAVIHLAGLVGDPACAVDPEFTRHTNIVATRLAKDVAQSLGVYRFIFASSCSVYGISDREATELDEINPVSLYAQTKIDSERELLSSGRDHFFVTVLRFATVFGHSRRPRFDLVGNLFTAQAMHDRLITVIGPRQWRPFIHVRDLAKAIVLTLQADPIRVQNQILNVGDSRLNMTILELGKTVQRVVGRIHPVELSIADSTDDRRNYAVSFDKICSILGFRAATLIEEGVQEMVEHFQRGTYQHYRDPIYSNVAMTKQALHEFYDPAELNKLYGPLIELKTKTAQLHG